MYDAATLAALERGDLIVRDFLTVHGRTRASVPVAIQFAYWTGESHVTIALTPPGATVPVSRNFVGDGMLRAIPEIVDAIGLEVRSVPFGFDHTQRFAGSPMDMVHGYDVRVAPVELHRALLDPTTWQPVSAPHLLMIGRVDGSDQDDAAAGSEGGLTLNVVSDAIETTMVSHAMKSDEQQQRRHNDRFRRHGDTVAQVETWWGMAKDDAKGGMGKLVGGGRPRTGGLVR